MSIFTSQEEFYRHYIKNFEVEIYKNSLKLCDQKLTTIKSEKYRKSYTYQICTNYFQLIENFLIFCLVLFHEKQIENIFIGQAEFYRNILLFKKEWFIEDLVNNYIGTNQKEYSSHLKEAMKDFFEHKDLLNSFKHWSRLDSLWRWERTMKIGEQKIWSFKYDSSIIYYHKKKLTIYQKTYYFNRQMIAIKSEFLINLIENIKKNFTNIGKKYKFESIYIKDETLKKKKEFIVNEIPIFDIQEIQNTN